MGDNKAEGGAAYARRIVAQAWETFPRLPIEHRSDACAALAAELGIEVAVGNVSRIAARSVLCEVCLSVSVDPVPAVAEFGAAIERDRAAMRGLKAPTVEGWKAAYASFTGAVEPWGRA